jgi:hypothetical protein
MATKLFITTDRNEAHARQAELAAEYPKSECRENGNVVEVWDMAEPERIAAPAPPPAATPPLEVKVTFTDKELDDLAARLAPRLAALMGA